MEHNIFEYKNGLRVWVSGSVTIDNIRHLISAGYVKCNSSLNGRPWNTTTEKSKCNLCYENSTHKKIKIVQLSLFD